MTCKAGLSPGSLDCKLACPQLRQGPLLAPCLQKASLHDCACDPANPSFRPCNDFNGDAPCVWAAGGAPDGGWPELTVKLPETTPSLRALTNFDLHVRICANQHLPLTWAGDDGRPVSADASTSWTLTEDHNSNDLQFVGVTVSGKGVGRPAWHPQVLAAPDAAVQRFGTCLYDATAKSLDFFKMQALGQLSGLGPAPRA